MLLVHYYRQYSCSIWQNGPDHEPGQKGQAERSRWGREVTRRARSRGEGARPLGEGACEKEGGGYEGGREVARR